jgi:hypothetical protein
MDVNPHLTKAHHQDYLKESKTGLLPRSLLPRPPISVPNKRIGGDCGEPSLMNILRRGMCLEMHQVMTLRRERIFMLCTCLFWNCSVGMLFTGTVRVCPLYKEEQFVNDIFVGQLATKLARNI